MADPSPYEPRSMDSGHPKVATPTRGIYESYALMIVHLTLTYTVRPHFQENPENRRNENMGVPICFLPGT